MSSQKQATALKEIISSLPGITADATLVVRQLGTALRILRMKQLVERTQLSRATLYNLMSSDPTFPPKISLSVRAIGFLESDVDTWIAARAGSRIYAK